VDGKLQQQHILNASKSKIYKVSQKTDPSYIFKLEEMANAMHCNLRPLDVVPVVLGFNDEAHNAPAYKFSSSVEHQCTYTPKFCALGQSVAELF